MSEQQPTPEQLKVIEIIKTYRSTIDKVREALKLMNIPDTLIEAYTINLPNFDRMIPDDVIAFFKDIRTMVILYLDFHGFSLREIARRVGCGHVAVNAVLKQYRDQMQALNQDLPVQKTNESIQTTSDNT